jgi:hypothetical protein
MNVSDLQHRISAIRADEAAVQDALSGLQSSLDAWLTAMTGVHDLLAAAAGVAAGELPKPQIESGGLVTAAEPAPLPSLPPAEKSMFSSPVRPAARPEVTDPVDPVSDEEDQALLESLDSETAGAIRVRRRLSGGRKSVRDLLAEIQTERKSPDQSQKKGWWS